MEPQTQTLFDSEPGENIARREVEGRARRGAHWFYWIAALSLVTSVMSLVGGGWAFFASLGVTQIFDSIANALAARWGDSVKLVAFVFDVLAAGLFALTGYFATKRHAWAFVTGMALYLLDALLFMAVVLLFGDAPVRAFIVLAFHGYVLYSVYGGYKACARIPGVDRNLPTPPPPVATPV